VLFIYLLLLSVIYLLRLFWIKVQLLVSDSDVENYKQIKVDLDELRLLVEKSELWVYKKKGDGKKEKKKTDDDDGEPAAEKVPLIIH